MCTRAYTVWKVACGGTCKKNTYASTYASLLTARAEVSRLQLSLRNLAYATYHAVPFYLNFTVSKRKRCSFGSSISQAAMALKMAVITWMQLGFPAVLERR
jgi:hypothetical protein